MPCPWPLDRPAPFSFPTLANPATPTWLRHASPTMRTKRGAELASLLGVLDTLDHRRVFRAVLVPHRLDRGLELLLLRVRDLNDLDAGGLGLVHGLLFVDVPEL